MFEEQWDHTGELLQAKKQGLQSEAVRLERAIEQFLDRIGSAENGAVASAYENRIATLTEQRAIVSDNIAKCGRPLGTFDSSLRTGLTFLANPCLLWRSVHYEHKRTVLRLAFDERLPYLRKQGFRTTNSALPFNALANFRGSKSELVGRVGIEPTTN